MPHFQFLWKVKLNNDSKQQYSLSSAVLVDSYIGYRGFRSYAFLGGASNNALLALDSDIGRSGMDAEFWSDRPEHGSVPGRAVRGRYPRGLVHPGGPSDRTWRWRGTSWRRQWRERA